MSVTNDGGSAFPVLQQKNAHDEIEMYAEPGMTLRDYFAAKVMQAIYMRLGGSPVTDTDSTGYMAANAYAMADAMLEARTS